MTQYDWVPFGAKELFSSVSFPSHPNDQIIRDLQGARILLLLQKVTRFEIVCLLFSFLVNGNFFSNYVV